MEQNIFSKENTSKNHFEGTLKEQVGSVDVITEGKAKIYVKTFEPKPGGKLEEQEVFYNPVQVFNRDLTILVINQYAKRLKEINEKKNGLIILEALAATGLRSLRFLKELDCINKIHINDLSESAIESIKKNIELNGLDYSKIQIENDDAINLMCKARNQFVANTQEYRYDVIDIDPYGSAIPFLDSAVQAVKDGGLICATFTDLRVLSGPDFYKCFYQYGVSRQKMICHQENAIRTILYSISSIANKNGRYIEPLLSYQSEFYARVFFTVNNGKKECAKSMVKTGMVYYCDECTNHYIQPFGRIHQPNQPEAEPKLKMNKIKFNFSVCEQCNSQLGLNGPVWLDQINDLQFVQKLRDEIDILPEDTGITTQKKITGNLHGILMEKEAGNTPYGFQMSRVAKFLKASLPTQKKLMRGMKSIGYVLRPSYFAPDQFKTNASNNILFDLIKAWKWQSSGNNEEQYYKNVSKDSPAYISLSQPIKIQPDFDFEQDQEDEYEKIVRFIPNPDKNWGPKKKATSKKILENLQEEEVKQDQNQQEKIIQIEFEDENDKIVKKQKTES